MKMLAFLSGDDADLAEAELSFLLKPEKMQRVDERLFQFSLDQRKAAECQRLAYTNSIWIELGSLATGNNTAENTGKAGAADAKNKPADAGLGISDKYHAMFAKAFSVIDWKKHYVKSHLLEISGAGFSQEQTTKTGIADILWRELKAQGIMPSADMKNPDMKIIVLRTDGKTYIAKALWENKKEYIKRKAHMRPELSPVSLDPKLARAAVNLLGISDRRLIIVDPFVGTGGLLLEAGLMGFKTAGYDIDRVMANKCKINLAHFGLGDYSIEQKDARLLESRFRYVVTDLPYARNSKAGELGKLYDDFIRRLVQNKVKRAVIMYPDFIDIGQILSKYRLKPLAEFSYYLHKSLAKKIAVIEPAAGSSGLE